MNWYIIIIVGVLLIALVVFLVKRNMADEKKFEEDMNQNYPHSKDMPKDVDTEDPMH